MKFVSALLLAAACASAHAQRRAPSALTERILTEAPHLVNLQYGVGWFGLLNVDDAELTLTVDDGPEETGLARLSGTLAPTLAYGYRLNRVLSVGAALSTQRLRFDRFRGFDDGTAANARLDVRRYLIGTRLLFHYGRSESVELYSGLRAGVTVWRFTARGFASDNVDLTEGQGATGLTPQLTLIPFGVRAYLTDELSLGGELGVGSPHILAAQVAYRF